MSRQEFEVAFWAVAFGAHVVIGEGTIEYHSKVANFRQVRSRHSDVHIECFLSEVEIVAKDAPIAELSHGYSALPLPLKFALIALSRYAQFEANWYEIGTMEEVLNFLHHMSARIYGI